MSYTFFIYLLIAQDISKSIKKITTFLGINVSDGEINKIAWKTSFSEMKNNATKENRDPDHTICALTSDRNLVFRKGKSGRGVALSLWLIFGSSSILPFLISHFTIVHPISCPMNYTLSSFSECLSNKILELNSFQTLRFP